MNRRRKKSLYNWIYDSVVYIILIGVAIVTIVPFLQVVTISLSPPEVASSYGLHLFPTKLDFNGYKSILGYDTIWTSYWNTIVRTAVGTGLSMLLYVMGAYPLSRRYLPHRKFWTLFIIFTMYFSGGLIPNYLLINNWLGISNTIWSLILPGAVSAYNLIIVRNFFESIPDSLEESAKIDGANDITILFRIVVPLSKPCLATVSLWSIVGHWNAWFDCMLYIREEAKYVLQYTLQRILIDGQIQDIDVTDVVVNTDTMKMAALVVSILPIIMLYPFLQKYFTKGVMVGAVKG
ncbi:MAG: carbohydrate ABC transporter permease [Hungatella sp.]|nr:carbohydrate ABC transporter permease [Hungatella sp.]